MFSDFGQRFVLQLQYVFQRQMVACDGPVPVPGC